MARWLAVRLPGPQHWVMYDSDDELLTLAAADPPDRASDGTPVTMETRRRDITRMELVELAGAALITASALLDMMTAEELRTTRRHLCRGGLPGADRPQRHRPCRDHAGRAVRPKRHRRVQRPPATHHKRPTWRNRHRSAIIREIPPRFVRYKLIGAPSTRANHHDLQPASRLDELDTPNPRR